jgi:DNA-binding MarR family transcriptional regulator
MARRGVNQLLRSLENLGYIVRSDLPNEGSERIVRFTKRGRAVNAKMVDVLRHIEREWGAEIGPKRFIQVKLRRKLCIRS